MKTKGALTGMWPAAAALILITLIAPPALADEPMILTESLDIAENSPDNSPTSPQAISVIDEDPSSLVFSITGGSGFDLFSVTSPLGEVTYTGEPTPLDHELEPSYTLDVTVQDDSFDEDSAIITVNVTDVDEPPVVNDQTFNDLPESSPNGATVGSVAASDPEGGDLSFSIAGTTAFAINSATGALTVADSSQLDFELSPSLEFTATVADPGPLQDSATITVNLSDVQENTPPTIEDNIDDVVVNEDSSPLEIDLWATFTDVETADALLDYTVSGNTNPALFTSTGISPATGKLTLVFAPNKFGAADISVTATDEGGLFVTDLFAVTVNPINDAPTVSDFAASAAEGTALEFTNEDFEGAYADIEGSSLSKIMITTLPANGQLKLNGSPVAQFQEVLNGSLDNLDFVPNPGWSGNTSFQWKGSDGISYSAAPANVNITISPINLVPTLDLNGSDPGSGFASNYVAGFEPVKVAGANMTIVDDDLNLISATVEIVNPKHGSLEVLSANVAGTPITVGAGSTANKLILTGTATIAEYTQVLKTITFHISSGVGDVDKTQRTISFVVNDGAAGSIPVNASVTIFNPKIELGIAPMFGLIPTGGDITFTITVTNTGDEALKDVVVDSDLAGCDKTYVVLAAGATEPHTCTKEDVQANFDHHVMVTADFEVPNTTTTKVLQDDALSQVTTVQSISVIVSTPNSPSSSFVKGEDAKFNITVVIPADGADLTNVQAKAYIAGGSTQATSVSADTPVPQCDKSLGNMDAGEDTMYSCTVPDVEDSFQLKVVVTGLDDDDDQQQATGLKDVYVLNPTLQALPNPSQIPGETATVVQFNLTLANEGSELLKIGALSSELHGNLLGFNNGITNNTCDNMILTVPAGVDRTCSFKATLNVPPQTLVDVISAVFEFQTDGDPAPEKVVEIESPVVIEVIPALQVFATADPANVVEPGGDVAITVQLVNNKPGKMTVDELVDSVIGNVDGEGDCQFPVEISGGAAYSCTFPVTVSGQSAGDSVTHILTAHSGNKEYEGSAMIHVLGKKVVLLPVTPSGAVAGEPNDSPCTAMPINTNQDNYFLADDFDDWYRFELDSTQIVEVELSNFMTTSGQLIVYAGTCSDLGSQSPIGHNGVVGLLPDRDISLGELSAGTTYFVRIVTASVTDASSKSPYLLRVSTSAAGGN